MKCCNATVQDYFFFHFFWSDIYKINRRQFVFEKPPPFQLPDASSCKTLASSKNLKCLWVPTLAWQCTSPPCLHLIMSHFISGLKLISQPPLQSHSLTFPPQPPPWGSLGVVTVVGTDVILYEALQLPAQALEGGPLTGLLAPALHHHLIDGLWAAPGLRQSVPRVQHLDHLVSCQAC